MLTQVRYVTCSQIISTSDKISSFIPVFNQYIQINLIEHLSFIFGSFKDIICIKINILVPPVNVFLCSQCIRKCLYPTEIFVDFQSTLKKNIRHTKTFQVIEGLSNM